MRHDFNGKNINIPDVFIDTNMRNLGITREECVQMWLDDEGFTTNDEVVAMSEKAKTAGAGAKATGEKTKRNPPVRKPDDVKRSIIEALAEFIETSDNASNVTITNVERMIAFSLGEDNYEVTLIKKRPAKN